jgi:NAD(P)H-dependent FMN reductase
MEKKVQIIIGSTRPGNIGTSIGKWFFNFAKSLDSNLEFELIDLAHWNLPMYNEPKSPTSGEYKYQHTKDWSKKISEADAYIFVTPEYNNGYPASLKNAIDYLYNEWNQKTAAIVSYGFRSGKMAAAQLRQVLEKTQMKVLEEELNIQLKAELYDEQGQLVSPEESLKEYEETVKKLVTSL